MSCVAPAQTKSLNLLPSDPRPVRMRSLVAWWALLVFVTAGVWATEFSKDYKNITLQVTLVLAVAGLSVWVLRSSGLPSRLRWTLAVLVWLPVWAVTPLGPVQLINNGNSGFVDWRWRWAATHDQSLAEVAAATQVQLDWQETENDYPRFLGNGYWAEAKDINLDSDWKANPPKLLWKQPIGAGWSGFAIVGDYAVTQEQRGNQEMVVCYELKTGQVAWSHADDARWDPSGPGALGGIGPRATPTVHDGRVYTHGATGIVNCIDAATGKRLWSHDTLKEYGAENISWGKADSPLIVDGTVVVSVGALDDRSLVAFDAKTGEQVWAGGARRSSYASPVLTELAGVRQILVVNENFLTSHDATTGEILWEHPWDGDSNGNASASQPVPVGDDRVFLSKGYGIMSQLFEVTHDESAEPEKQWSTEVLWSKPVLRTKLGNVVIRDGVIYGIDDIDMDCAELETGRRRWKKRRRPELGHGQIILVGDKILVISEAGELVLLAADPKKYRELAQVQAIEGITWNNPAISGRYLLVRNGQEVACFELPVAASPPL
jgi:outer membrane protein assembly factor BamB